MRGHWTAWVRGFLIAVSVLAYYLVAHYASANESSGLLSMLLGVVPFSALILLLCWQSSQRILLTTVSLLLIGGLAIAWPYLNAHPSWMYLLQHAGGNLLLTFIFGRTLFGGRQPLVTYFASFVHRPTMSPLVARYTRQVTLGWTVFFLVMATLSILLFMLAPVETWSIFANLLSMPLITCMFIGEYLVRRRVVPAHERTSIAGSIRAYRTAFEKSTTVPDERP